MANYFLEVGLPGSATTLAAPGYTIGNTGITVASTTNWPGTGKDVAFAIDRVDGNGVRIDGTYCEFTGTVSSSTSITNVVRVFGTPQNYAAGATTRVMLPVTSTRENSLIQGLDVEHNLDGTHDNTKVALLAGSQTFSGTKTFSAIPVVPNASWGPSKLATGATGALVTNSETTASTSYVDLSTTTDSVTVTVGANGIALVLISCSAGNGSNGGYVRMSFAVSGTSTVAAGVYYAEAQEPGASASSFYPVGGTFLVTGLTPGSCTFKAKYNVSTGTGTFNNRRIAVVPL